MRNQTERAIALTDLSINALEGGLMGAMLGAPLSALVACLVWFANVTLFGGLPAGQDIVYSLGIGAAYGAFAGALWALADYWTHKLS